MVTRALVDWEIAEGRRLIQALDGTDLRVSTAFWMFDPFVPDWRLHLACAALEHRELVAMYSLVDEAMQKAGLERLNLNQIKLISPSQIQAVVKELQRALERKPSVERPRWYSSSSTTTESPNDLLFYRSS